MGRLQLDLLGGFRLSWAGEPLQLSARKSRALLSFLCLAPETEHPRETLARLLWESSDDAQARSSLRQALATIRKALPESHMDLVVSRGDLLALNGEQISVDVHDFESFAANGSPEALDRAVALYRGDLLEGENPKAPNFEDWLFVQRRRLHEQAVVVTEALLDHLLAAGENRRGIDLAVRALAMDPLHEHFHRTLMRLYAAVGQTNAALRQYRLCRIRLNEDLGVAPDPQTERAHAEILAQRNRPSPLPSIHAPATRTPAPSEAPAAPFAIAPAGPQLRQVSVLHVRGHALASEEDPEKMRDRVGAFFECADGVIAAHGGTVTKHAGDAVTGVFGIPQARTSDAARAFACAQAIHDCLGARPTPIVAGVGIACGRVLVSELGSEHYRQIETTGAAVNRAADLAASAEAGQTLLDDEARRLQLLPRASFVGRAAELRQIESALDVAADHGTGSLILIRGEAGIGKSRLVEEASSLAADRGFSRHTGKVLDFGEDRGLGAIATLIGGLVEEDLVPVDLRVFLSEIIGREMPAELTSLLHAMDETARARGRRRLLSELVFARSASQPLLLVLEDIHWADASTRSLAASLFATVAQCPAVFVLTERAEEGADDPQWRSALETHSLTTIHLGPLRSDEARTLALSEAGQPEERAEACAARAGGHPFFLLELLRSGAPAGEVPSSVHTAVLARMDRLSEGQRSALEAAAVMGLRFTPESITHLLQGEPLDPAQAPSGWLTPDGDELAFSHALIRDAIYSSLVAPKRKRLHEQAAEWFSGRDSIRRARHLERAGHPDAGAAYEAAARELVERCRYEEAIELCERAAALAAPSEIRYQLACTRGRILRELGRIEESLLSLQGALALADTDAQRLGVRIGIAAALRIGERNDEALELLREAQQPAEEMGAHLALARIHNLRGNLLFPTGVPQRCLAEHEAAATHAERIGATRELVQALSGLGDAEYSRGRLRTAYEHFNRCIEFSRQEALVDVEVANLPMRGYARAFILDLEGGLQDCLRAAELSTRIGNLRAEILSRVVGSILASMRADWGLATDLATRSLAQSRRIGAKRFEAECLRLMALGHAGWGEIVEAERLAGQARDLGLEHGPTYIGPTVLGSFARFAQDPRAREEALRQGEALLSRGCVSHNYFDFYAEAIEAGLAVEDWDLVSRYADALEDYTREEALPLVDLIVERARALVATVRPGSPDPGRTRLAAIRTRLAGVGFVAALRAIEQFEAVAPKEA